MPQLWVVAGPNGAGKSTLTRRYLVGRLPIVNPDVLAQELAPEDTLKRRGRLQMGREALHMQESLLTQSLDFAVETTLSGHREMALLQRARELVLRTAHMVPIVSLDIMRLTAFQQV